MTESKLTHRALVLVMLLLFALLPGVTPAQTSAEPQIHLQWASFDPLMGEPALPAGQNLSTDLDQPGLYLLQFTGPIPEEWKAAVEARGARLYAYVPDYAFVARMDADAKDQVSALSFVRWVGRYQPIYRVAPGLQNFASGQQDARPLDLLVQTLPDVDLDRIASRAESLGANVHSRSKNDLAGYLHMDLPPGRVSELSALDGVLWIEPYSQPRLLNDVGGGAIMNAGTIHASLGLYGSGQIVGIADTGLDVGRNDTSMSDDFKGRIQSGESICADWGSRNLWSDTNGHGTHVAGSVLGNGSYSGSNPGLHQYGGTFAGVAPEARVVFQSVGDFGNILCVPDNIENYLFAPAYSKGARIHTNSWGGTSGNESNPYGVYTSYSHQADSAAWNMKDMAILFAAGNAGEDRDENGLVDLDSLASPGTAKNVITVGASENLRTGFTVTWGAGFPADNWVDPIFNDPIADDQDGMAPFSSRGPTDDGRIKPDLVAPGTLIISARSHDPNSPGDGDLLGWGHYDANYFYNGGTSMATPLAAGAAALVREWLTELRGVFQPSASVIKAVLINGAADMSPGQYTSPQEIPAQRPNKVTGWGRVDLEDSLKPASPQKIWLKDYATAGLTTGKSLQFTLVTGPSGLSVQQNAGTNSDKTIAEDQVVNIFAEIQEPASVDPGNASLAPSRPVELRIDSLPADQPVAGNMNSIASTEAAVPLVLDDGSLDNSIGVVDVTSAYQFIWLNRFTPDPSNFPFDLEEIRVMFYENPSGTLNVNVGDEVDLVVYQDADGNPANGATLLATYHTSIPVVDGMNWSVYELSSPLKITGPGDVLIGIINRYVIDGVTPKSYPATLDQTATKNRSWIGWWMTTPPNPAILPPDSNFSVMSASNAGNWLIRGYGQTSSPPLTTGGPLRITLAWTDYPATPGAGKMLVNDLDLEVIAPDGKHYYGNTGVYNPNNSCVRAGQWDRCNNVEGMLIPKAFNGSYTVIVHGYNVPNGPQPFALVASGDYIQEGLAGQNKIFLPITVR